MVTLTLVSLAKSHASLISCIGFLAPIGISAWSRRHLLSKEASREMSPKGGDRGTYKACYKELLIRVNNVAVGGAKMRTRSWGESGVARVGREGGAVRTVAGEIPNYGIPTNSYVLQQLNLLFGCCRLLYSSFCDGFWFLENLPQTIIKPFDTETHKLKLKLLNCK